MHNVITYYMHGINVEGPKIVGPNNTAIVTGSLPCKGIENAPHQGCYGLRVSTQASATMARPRGQSVNLPSAHTTSIEGWLSVFQTVHEITPAKYKEPLSLNSNTLHDSSTCQHGYRWESETRILLFQFHGTIS